jgi:hypothetical protein
MKLQLLQPIAGVRPTLLSSAFAVDVLCVTANTTSGMTASPAATHRTNLFILVLPRASALLVAIDLLHFLGLRQSPDMVKGHKIKAEMHRFGAGGPRLRLRG